jgi:5-methylcytosine-specific restriction protein B
MSIPKNISKGHIEKAIVDIEKSGVPANRLSKEYILKVADKQLPPKYVISIANKYANSVELNSDDFNAVEAKNFLKKLGFEIITKDLGFYSELFNFILVANKQITGKGTTIDATNFNRERLREFKKLKIEVSFGIGRANAVPWISFLGNGQTTSNGIYPVYLYFKEKKVLILAYGVSETNHPKSNWRLQDPITIESYFEKNNLGVPEHYGSSFVYKAYKTDRELNKIAINNDLNNIIQIYNQEILGKQPFGKNPVPTKKFEQSLFFTSALDSGLSINSTLSLRFTASLLTKPFVILTGLSGSGKTKLAQAFAMWICENETQYCLVPVGADWTNREPLLGFPNALKSNEYIKPDNKVLDLLISASDNQNKPYFLILDEMNMSHVERYFADFLSVMESGRKLSLHNGFEYWNDVPTEIELPNNLFIIGTVNIDETTYMFSPKVLDRANVIEFRVTADEMKNYLNKNTILEINKLKSAGADMSESFVKMAKDKTLQAINSDILETELLSFFNELKRTGAEFGFRSASEIFRFTAVVNTIEPGWSMPEIIDAAIMQKLLPKVHGSRRKLEPVLKTLGNLCLQTGQNFDDYVAPKSEIVFHDSERIKYPLSLEKILRMYQGLLDNGFTSYAEA